MEGGSVGKIITSGKQFRVVLTGEIPPGVAEDQFAALVAQSVTVGLQLMPFLKESKIDCPYISTDAPQRGPSLHF